MNDGEATVPLVADDGTELISRADSNADRGAKEDTEDSTVSILKQGYCGSVRGNPRLMRMGEWKDKSGKYRFPPQSLHARPHRDSHLQCRAQGALEPVRDRHAEAGIVKGDLDTPAHTVGRAATHRPFR